MKPFSQVIAKHEQIVDSLRNEASVSTLEEETKKLRNHLETVLTTNKGNFKVITGSTTYVIELDENDTGDYRPIGVAGSWE